jgi:hypothetical protein
VEEEKGCCVSALFLAVLNSKLRAISGRTWQQEEAIYRILQDSKVLL